MNDSVIDEIFLEDTFYPGSKKTRSPQKSSVEFVSDPWRENYTVKTIGRDKVRLYPIGAICDALGVSVQTMRYWIKHGRIPQAPYRLPSNMLVKGEKVAGRRLYTEEIIDATVEIFTQHGLLGQHRIFWDKHPEVPIEIVETWTRIIKKSPGTTTD